MWHAYWETVRTSSLDWLILTLGGALIAAHVFGLVMRAQGTRVLFVQGLDRYRTFCLLFTELLPVLGLLGTVLSLMYTFKTFQAAAAGENPDLSQMVRAFAPALSTTISGLLMIGPNLVLNAILWLASPLEVKGQD
jgi:hypothetical protein